MRYRNDGISEDNKVQNRFTAYLMTALQRRRAAYLRAQARLARHEAPMDLSDYCPDDAGAIDQEDALLESVALSQALEQIGERDRYILLARALEGQDFEALAAALGLSYKGVTTAYYRALRRLKEVMGGEKP